MPNPLAMPRLSDTMEVGTIVKWHVKPGQKLKSGDVVADVETDKATMELQTFDEGVVGALMVKEGQACPVGTAIMNWEGGAAAGTTTNAVSVAANAGAGTTNAPATSRAGQAVGAGNSSAGVAGSGATATALAIPPASSTGDHHADGVRVFASPLARKIAADTGVDLNRLEGTGPSGRIVRKDVEDFIQTLAAPAARSAPATPAPMRTQPLHPAAAAVVPGQAFTHTMTPMQGRSVALSSVRATIAKRLIESKTTIPHYQVTVAARMDALMALRQQLNDQLSGQGVKLSVNDFLVRACALAMHQHPFINARWVNAVGGAGPSIQIVDRVNIGVAVSLPEDKGGGLVVATIRDADQKGLRLISAETKALAEKARTRGLSLDDMSESTFTISNLGMYGVEHFTAIINPPNAAILAVGAAVKKPVVETRDGKDEIVVGHEMQMTISSDHRIIDGAMAAAYLATVKQMLERPATLLV